MWCRPGRWWQRRIMRAPRVSLRCHSRPIATTALPARLGLASSTSRPRHSKQVCFQALCHMWAPTTCTSTCCLSRQPTWQRHIEGMGFDPTYSWLCCPRPTRDNSNTLKTANEALALTRSARCYDSTSRLGSDTAARAHIPCLPNASVATSSAKGYTTSSTSVACQPRLALAAPSSASGAAPASQATGCSRAPVSPCAPPRLPPRLRARASPRVRAARARVSPHLGQAERQCRLVLSARG